MRLATLVLLILCTAWAAGALVVGGLVAPGVFALAPPRGDALTRQLAGLVVGEVLMRWSLTALILWAAVLACLVRLATGLIAGRRWRWAVLVLVAAVVLLGLRPLNHALVSEGRALAAEIRRDPAALDDGRAAHFRARHGLAMAVGLAEVMVVLAIAGAATVAVANASGAPRRP
jgi:hypothetical protein